MEIKLENISEIFVKELCKEPNIKEAFIREGIIEETKQETLEEASIKYAMEEYGSIELKDYTPEMKLNYARLALAYKQGAKWQQEQDKNLYSEEDLLKFTQTIIMQYKFGNTNIEQIDLLKETLEQFKK
jgi:hypothetical protein